MSEGFTIEVTNEEIAAGCRGDADNCPIALAIIRCVPGSYHVCVGDDSIEFTRNAMMLCYDTPEPFRRFMIDYDAGRPVGPVTAVLEGDGLAHYRAGLPENYAGGRG